MSNRAMRPRAAAEYIGVRPTKFYAMIKAGELPEGTPVSGRVRVWFEDELDAFLEQRRAAARRQNAREGEEVADA